MKRLSVLFFIVIVFVFSQISFCSSFTGSYISANELNLLLQKQKKSSFHLISVLPKFSHKDCRIPGSVNIPLHRLEKISRLMHWDKNDHIVLYCASSHCPLSRYGLEALKEHGFKNVQVLQGGLMAWNDAMLPAKGVCRAGYLRAAK